MYCTYIPNFLSLNGDVLCECTLLVLVITCCPARVACREKLRIYCEGIVALCDFSSSFYMCILTLLGGTR
jgi:hypothetical protein